MEFNDNLKQLYATVSTNIPSYLRGDAREVWVAHEMARILRFDEYDRAGKILDTIFGQHSKGFRALVIGAKEIVKTNEQSGSSVHKLLVQMIDDAGREEVIETVPFKSVVMKNGVKKSYDIPEGQYLKGLLDENSGVWAKGSEKDAHGKPVTVKGTQVWAVKNNEPLESDKKKKKRELVDITLQYTVTDPERLKIVTPYSANASS